VQALTCGLQALKLEGNPLAYLPNYRYQVTPFFYFLPLWSPTSIHCSLEEKGLGESHSLGHVAEGLGLGPRLHRSAPCSPGISIACHPPLYIHFKRLSSLPESRLVVHSSATDSKRADNMDVVLY